MTKATAGLHSSVSLAFALHKKLFEVIGDRLNSPEKPWAARRPCNSARTCRHASGLTSKTGRHNAICDPGDPARSPSDPGPEQTKRPSFGEPSSNSGKDTDMNKTRALDWHIVRRTVALAVIASLAGSGVQAWARGVAPYAAPPTLLGSSSLSAGQSIVTSRGPAFVTGNAGSMNTIALPGGGQGFLMNNGNGSSTLIAPGAVPQTLITPR
jgi:hypothetical protein